MARTIDSTGDIETVCKVDPLKTGESAILIFRADDPRRVIYEGLAKALMEVPLH